jgi:hypothetical protein
MSKEIKQIYMVQEKHHSSVDLQMTHHAEIQEKEKSWRTCPAPRGQELKTSTTSVNQINCWSGVCPLVRPSRSTLFHNIKPGRSAFEICMEVLAIFTSRLMPSSAQTFSSTTSQPVAECKLSSLMMPQESDV